jgi:hypothetical protein
MTIKTLRIRKPASKTRKTFLDISARLFFFTPGFLNIYLKTITLAE